MRSHQVVVAVRGDRLALARVELGTADVSPGAPQDELLQLYGIDEEGRIALQVWFDIEDMDAALAELDAAHARLESDIRDRRSRTPRVEPMLGSTRSLRRRWDEIGAMFTDDIRVDDRRQGLRREGTDRATERRGGTGDRRPRG